MSGVGSEVAVWLMLNISGMGKNDIISVLCTLPVCVDLYINIFKLTNSKHLCFEIHAIQL